MSNYKIKKDNASKTQGLYLIHAAKGSTWSNHKYIRIENGRYIYQGDENDVKPSNSDLSKIDTSNVNLDSQKRVDIANDKLDEAGTKQIAKLLIGGLYGDANQAKKLLGKNYESIQAMADKMVNDNEIDPSDVKKQMEAANVLIAALAKQKKNKNKNKKSSSKNTDSAKKESTSNNDEHKDVNANKTLKRSSVYNNYGYDHDYSIGTTRKKKFKTVQK